MKNLLTCFMLLGAVIASAQLSISVDVKVVDDVGQGVEDASIGFFAFSTDTSFLLEEEGVTETDGILTINFDIPSTVTEAIFVATQLDCFQPDFSNVLYEVGVTDYAIEMEECSINPDTNQWSEDTCFAFITCDHNGDLVAIGHGEPEFTYEWSTGDTTETITPADTGIYCVTITDANDCISTACTTVHPQDTTGGWDSCFAFIYPDLDSTGNFVLVASGPFGSTYTYEWSTGETTETILLRPSLGEVCVTIDDGNGCVAEACFDFKEFTGIEDSCFAQIFPDIDGNLVAVGFGEPNLTFEWSTGETTQGIMPQDTGEYCVTITDALGCVATACTFVHPIDTTGGPDSCFAIIYLDLTGSGDTVAVAEGFGTPNFTYLWSTGDTSQTIPFDPTLGEVCVTITDANGCVAEFCIDLSQWGGNGGGHQDSCLAVISCEPNGDLLAIGFGQPSFTYEWSTGETTPVITPQDTGEYCVTITDANGCVAETCTFVHGGGVDTTGVVGIFGYVTTFDTMATLDVDGVEVELYKKNAAGDFELDRTMEADGDVFAPFFLFGFEDLENGTYLIKAIPDSKDDSYLPTYYWNSEVWDEAQEIQVNDDNQLIEVQLLQKIGLPANGNGEIRGSLVDANGFVDNGSEGGNAPVANAMIFLEDVDGTVLETRMTNSLGQFEFLGVHSGQYMLTFDHLNLESLEIMVELHDGQTAEIDIVSESGTTSTDISIQDALSIWPNPMSDQLNIELDESFIGGNLTVTNVQGQVTGQYILDAVNQVINLQHLNVGTYFVHIQNDDRIITQKVIKR